MKLNFKLYFLLLFTITSFSQKGFEFESKKSKVSFKFQLVNNLIIIPLEVNGTKLNFLLDTGVSETIIFSLDDANEVNLNHTEAIQMKGFGKKEYFIAYRCKDNSVGIKDYVDKNHTIYLVLDQDINISSQVGIPVNGIIGSHFFENYLIAIDYVSKKIMVSKRDNKMIDKIEKKYLKIPISIEESKPYLLANIEIENQNRASKLLIDSGNNDALWIFDSKTDKFTKPKNAISDFLGRGLNGDVFGKRAKIGSFFIGVTAIKKPIASFPDSIHTMQTDMVDNRAGSLGAELLRRMDLIFDYNSKVLYYRKNSNFDDPFLFNRSGLEIQHQGLEWDKLEFETNPARNNYYVDVNGDKAAPILQYKFVLKPVFVISNIRKNAPSELAGLQKGDILSKINGRKTSNLTLQQINELLKSEDIERVQIEILRNDKPMKFEFELISIL